jgi:Kef-type K+ transport system membrane component KefB
MESDSGIGDFGARLLQFMRETTMAVSLALITLAGLLADALFRWLRLPGLVGMLLVGVLLGPYVLDLLSPGML